MLKQHESEVENWLAMLKQQAQFASDKICNVLMFPDGGWMRDQAPDEPPDEQRAHQLALLRQYCIPHLVFVLQSILQSSSALREALQLADIVTSERFSLYQLFTREQLQDLLKKLRETSIQLLNDSTDPLGYSELN